MSKIWEYSVLAMMCLACGSQNPLDVGDEAGDKGDSLLDYAATWSGYAQAANLQAMAAMACTSR